MSTDKIHVLEADLMELFRHLSALQDQIRQRLIPEADGKKLKGNELVGWLGEIYGKILLNGKLVSDREEHDFECQDGRRVSVKTRKGNGSGWRQTSAIPKFEDDECPTHLMFVHLNNDYSLDRVWLYPWSHLAKENRFKSHVVRKQHRSYIFSVDEKNDEEYLIFKKNISADPKKEIQTVEPVCQNNNRKLPRSIERWSRNTNLKVHKIIALVVQSGKISRSQLVKKIAEVTNSENPSGALASLLTNSGNAYGRVFTEKNGFICPESVPVKLRAILSSQIA